MGGAALLGGALLYGVSAKGGFDPAGRWTVTLLACLAAAVAVASGRGRRRSSLRLAAGVAGPFLIAVTVSAVANGGLAGSGGWYAAALVVAATVVVAATADNHTRIVLVRCAEAAAVIVAATSWWGVSNHRFPWAIVAQDLWRGSSTITYANAAGTVCGAGLVIALTDRSLSDLPRRMLSAALIVGAATTLSRGAVGATAAGLAVGLLAGRREGRRTLANLAWAMVAAAAALAALAPSFPAATRLDGSLSPAHPWIALAGVAAAASITVGSTLSPSRRTGVATAVVATLGVIGIAAGPLHEHLVEVGRLASDHRLTVASEDRDNEWSAAWREFERSPIVGVGPGRTAYVWNSPSGAFRAQFAHNEALEVLATLGVIGALASATGAVVFARSIRWTPAAAGVLTIVATQALVDFTLHLPVVLILAVIATELPTTHPGALPT